MDRKRAVEREIPAVEDERMVREGHLLVEEEIVRGGGPVTYAGTVEGARAAPRADLDRPAAAAIPSMSNDATAASTPTTDSMMTDWAANEIINLVREGMTVVDAAGEKLGSVDHVKMGDPGAATVGADRPAPGLVDVFLGGGEPDVPEPFRSRLLRLGYVKIDGTGWIDTDRYVTADLIGGVSGDTVRLTVDKEWLLSDQM